ATELDEALGILEISAKPGEERESIVFTAENTRRLLEESFDGTFINVGGKIAYINGVGARILGAKDQSELIGRPIAEVVHPDHHKLVARRIKVICEQDRPVPVIELVFVRLDGSVVDVESMATKVYYEGKPAIRVVFRDIGERKAIEKALRESEQRFRGIYEQAPLGIALIDSITGQFLHINPKYTEIIGRTEAEMQKLTFMDISYPEDLPADLDNMARLLSGEIPGYHMEKRLIRGDGSVIWVRLTVVPLWEEGEPGPARSHIAMVEDVTGRKIADEALRASEERFRALADTSGAAILAYQEDRFVYSNLAAQKLTGYSAAELLSMNFWDLVAPEFREQVKEIGRKRQTGKAAPVRYETRVLRKDGGEKWADISAGYFTFQNRPTVIITGMDVTDRKRIEKELKDAKAQSELYLDLMGHDINNMNMIAMGFLEIALGSFPLTDEQREFLEKPIDTLKNSTKLIENVRKLQKLERGRLKHRAIDLCDVLRQAIGDYAHVPGRDVAIRFESLPACFIVGNDLIKDVFSNLIGNSIKHSDPQRPLTIDVSLKPVTKEGKKYYKITIEDNGPGIPDKLKNRLFMRLQRGPEKAIGKGLGLYLVRTLVHDFHGTIWGEDRVPGDYKKGARFVVMLPAAK
ncbi:MAG TPA: PAS domain S-box protein, partial [Methanocella sp.]|nr:PAS domain S-box protein [Methanocella sp.]